MLFKWVRSTVNKHGMIKDDRLVLTKSRGGAFSNWIVERLIGWILQIERVEGPKADPIEQEKERKKEM